MKTTTVTVNGKFPQMKPAHHAHITKQGQGSNLRRAINDAVTSIFADERLKGKRTTVLSPCSFTVAVYDAVEVSDE